ncbi:Serine/threonine-protein phosphatase 2A activator 2 [Actinomortierella ambigua]|nr:Serine/threonine-protein phosphatase 2A activator 2 [Actinomortierella ambigua]
MEDSHNQPIDIDINNSDKDRAILNTYLTVSSHPEYQRTASHPAVPRVLEWADTLPQDQVPSADDIRRLKESKQNDSTLLNTLPCATATPGHRDVYTTSVERLGQDLDAIRRALTPVSSVRGEPPSPTLTATATIATTTSATDQGDNMSTLSDADDEGDQEPTATVAATNKQGEETKQQNNTQEAPEERPKFVYTVPKREILTKEDLERFHASDAYKKIFDFLDELNEAVVGVTTTADCHVSEVTQKMLQVLDEVAQVAKDYPPESGHESRFGNPAFRKFYDQIGLNASHWMVDVLGVHKEAGPELVGYFTQCWGNRKRIDYGTGHEANFLAFLYCMKELEMIKPQDYRATVLKVFVKYIEVMRTLQFSYWLEPAGSHGVWGLDDYHFLPFLFGAAQLRGHKYIRPKSIHDEDVVSEFAKDYMYLSCIQFINSVKTASLRWHSPMLDDISAVKTWDKVNSGMIKMYKAEVFGKLPIMQHFLFGGMIQFQGSQPADLADDEETGADGHQHVHAFGQEFPTCCGMKIPSAIAAAKASEGAAGNRALPSRRIPFD